ncbi:MAG: glycoside hydrolase family 2 TIM barrel-domain containing protein [Akkermansia sp.]
MKILFPFIFASILTALPLPSLGQTKAIPTPEFSTAGFFSIPDSPRKSHNFNLGWKFYKGNVDGADKQNFDDTSWETVNTPHGLELIPEEASGCSNYQGPAWYRKTFTAPTSLKGKKNTLYFEGVLGKSKIYLNGKLLQEHLGGYLPIIVDMTDELDYGQPNVISVLVDNSNDPSYPPGKSQTQLDFCYFGGIYRDVYLIETDLTHITDANSAEQEAGGGLFFRTLTANDQKASVGAKIHVINESDSDKNLTVSVKLLNSSKKQAGGYEKQLTLKKGEHTHVDGEWNISQPDLWSPDFPHLNELLVEIKEGDKILDAYRQKVGIRHFVMNDKGFQLNEKPFPGKIIGGNRHQDFAYLGNAVSNIAQWRDAKKLREAGMRVVRSAHYPQDPAFMDAADQLGLFVIVATPDWQFWNKTPQFSELVYTNIRQMIRRDRNHACLWSWEPILNETPYPKDFALNAYNTTHKEYPYPSCYAGCDRREAGADQYDLLYTHPINIDKQHVSGIDPLTESKRIKGKAYFTREFGDNVDDWGSHNSTSRTARKWGEIPMLIQAKHYIAPDYEYTCWEKLCQAPDFHIGGALWHPFDHQRGYHPDPFLGGIMDAFRQPKIAYYAFQAQRPSDPKLSEFSSGPFIYIANEMTPFSPEDVTVYTNCDEIRLTAFDSPPITKQARKTGEKRLGTSATFEKTYDFVTFKNMTNSGKGGHCFILAEGIINGKVVTKHQITPARRPQKIKLSLDNEGVPLQANGTDFAVVVASITDGQGNIKRLNDEVIQFSVEGPAEIIGDASIGANPRAVEWGTAPVLIRTTNTPGKVKVHAHVRNEGAQKPAKTTLEFETVPSNDSFINGITQKTKSMKLK